MFAVNGHRRGIITPLDHFSLYDLTVFVVGEYLFLCFSRRLFRLPRSQSLIIGGFVDTVAGVLQVLFRLETFFLADDSGSDHGVDPLCGETRSLNLLGLYFFCFNRFYRFSGLLY